MKLFTKLIIGGAALAGISALRKAAVQARANPPSGLGADSSNVGMPGGMPGARIGTSGASALAEGAGISDVDPQGLSQMVEAVDPDEIRQAHAEIVEQKDRLPRS